MTKARISVFVLVILLAGVTAGYAQQDGWMHLKRSGPNPLAERQKWSTEHVTGQKSIAATQLAKLLDFKGGSTEPERLDINRNYVVAVGTDLWTDMYLLRTGCFNFGKEEVLQIETSNGCDLADTRIMNSPAVSVIGIKTFSPSTTLEWDVTTKKRKRLDVMGFISFVLPALGAGLRPAEAGEYQYSVHAEPVAIASLPADLEVAAKYTRNINGQPKAEAFSRTFNNYGNEIVSLGVGAGVSKVKDINLNLASNSLTANDINKLKTFGLVALHPQPVDPYAPRTWNLPYVLAAIEISADHLNYGGGFGWRLPFVNNTGIAVAFMHNLPDVADNAKASAGGQRTTREWKTTYMIHYTFPLPKGDQKQ